MNRVSPLEVSHLVKKYGSYTAVNDISFSIEEGQCFSLLGPNGAGKSTTISCLSGIFPPTSGSLKINGFDVYKNPREAKKFLGVCPQENSLETEFSIYEQLILHASYFGISKSVAKIRAKALLEALSLEDKILSLSDTLSGGMKRRLQLARALMNDPKVLILDEPTTGLDPEARRILWNMIRRLKEKKTAILLTTHYMDEAEKLSDTIALIYKGKIFDCGSPQKLIEKHIPEKEIEEQIRPGIYIKRPPNLEDVFLKLAGSTIEQRFFHSYE